MIAMFILPVLCLIIFMLWMFYGQSSKRQTLKHLATPLAGLGALMLLLAIVAGFSYYQNGSWPESRFQEKMQPQAAQNAADSDSVDDFILQQQQLKRLLRRDPENIGYWYMLANNHSNQQQYLEAAQAYEAALVIKPNDFILHVSAAYASFVANNFQLTKQVRGHIDAVMAVDDSNAVILGILGTASYRAQQFDVAIRFWKKALLKLPPQSMEAQSLRQSIAIAQGVEFEPEVKETSLTMSVHVNIDPSVQLSGGEMLFVYLRQVGQKMPLIVRRVGVESWPQQIELTEDSAMIQGVDLDSITDLEIVARISRSGQPSAVAGDYQVISQPFAKRTHPESLKLLIKHSIK